MARLTREQFVAKYELVFADNNIQNITEAVLRDFRQDVADSYASLAALNVRQVKGATYPVPYTDSLGTIPPAYCVLGMYALARNGQPAATAATQPPQPPLTFQLVANAGGPVVALVDEQPGTVTTANATWVQASGSAQQVRDSFPLFVAQNPDGSPHPYQAGDKFRYVFADGSARLFEVRAYLNVPSNPLPTGQDLDPAYRPYAPLLVGAVLDAYTKAETDELLAEFEEHTLAGAIPLSGTTPDRPVTGNVQANKYVELVLGSYRVWGDENDLRIADTSNNLLLRVEHDGLIIANPTGSGSQVRLSADADGGLLVNGQPIADGAYTDTQARAAQVNRIAPINTTTVTLTAESPTDYGTMTSGLFTIDASAATPGVCAFFRVGAGGSEPNFTNAQANRPYNFDLTAAFTAGKMNRYAVYVFADYVEVINIVK